jgi:iron complex outermembrane receptor protein
MKTAFTFVLLLGLASICTAWTEISGNVRGIVTNQESGQVIRGATITLVPFGEKRSKAIEKSFSQDAGEFLFNEISPGLYNLECSAFGFKTTRLVGIQVREDRTKLAFFKMERGSAAETLEVYTYAALEAQKRASTQTSTSDEEALGDAPATIYVVTAEDIVDNGYMSLDEVLADIPEFELQYRSNSEENNVVSARGIYGNDKLLILKDGHRFNSMVSSRYAMMENYGIRYAKRIEIILGPASALYGADAYMGVVNIITKKGNEIRAVKATSSYGNFNTSNSALQFGWGTEKISFAIEGGFFNTNGANLNEVYENEFRFYNQNYLQNGTVLVSPFQPNATQTLPIQDFSLKRYAGYFNARLDYKKFNASISFNRITFSSSVSALPQYSAYWNSSTIGTSMLNLNLHQDYAFKKGSKWSASTDFTSSITGLPPSSNFVNSFSSYRKAYKIGADVGGRLQQTLGYKLHKNHSITAGINIQNSNSLPQTSDLPRNISGLAGLATINTVEQDIYYLGTNITDSDGNSLKIYQNFYYMRRILSAAFAEYRGNIKDKLLVTFGVRYDQIIDYDLYSRNNQNSAKSYFNFSPRVGLVYKALKNLNFKFFAGQGFLQPSPERKFDHFGTFQAAPDGNSLVGTFWRVPNPDLLPEKVRSLELSSTYSKGDFTVSINSYFNEIMNPIVLETDFSSSANDLSFLGIPIETRERSVNSEEPTLAYGTTLFAAYRLVYGKEEEVKIKFRASYSYANGDVFGFERLPYTAMHTAKLGILFKYRNFSINNSFLFRSESYSNGFITEDGSAFQYQNTPFLLWNLFARYQIYDKKKVGLSVFVKVNNVLNNRYYHVTDNSTIAFGATPQDPIRFLAGLSFLFGRKK